MCSCLLVCTGIQPQKQITPEAHRHRRATSFSFRAGVSNPNRDDRGVHKKTCETKADSRRNTSNICRALNSVRGGRVRGSRRVVVWPCYCTLEFQAVSLPYYINTQPPCANVGSCQAPYRNTTTTEEEVVGGRTRRRGAKSVPQICRNTVCIVSPAN